MQRHCSITKLFAVLFVAATLATLAFAQTPPAQQTYSVVVVQVKPEMGGEWQDFLKNHANPALQKGGVKQRSVWTTATFGEGGEYVLVTPIESLSQYDNPSPVVKALGQEGETALLAKRQRLITGYRTFMITARPDLGVAPKAGYAFKLGVGATVNVTPGRIADYEKSLKDLSAALAKTNAKGVLVSRVGLGGDPNSYITLALFDNWDDVDKFPAAFAKASADAKLAPPAAGIVAHTEWRVYRFVPELSIIPAAQKAENKRSRVSNRMNLLSLKSRILLGAVLWTIGLLLPGSSHRKMKINNQNRYLMLITP
jgi:hypothetical protein